MRAVVISEYDFVSTGDANFFAQSGTVKVGSTSAQSGNISDDQISFLYTFVEGGEPIAFDWKVSSEAGFDGLLFYYLDENGDPVGDIESISGNSDWRTVNSTVPGQGLHFVVWAYLKDEIISAGQDTGWIDNVRIGKDGPSPALNVITNYLLDD